MTYLKQSCLYWGIHYPVNNLRIRKDYTANIMFSAYAIQWRDTLTVNTIWLSTNIPGLLHWYFSYPDPTHGLELEYPSNE